MSTSSRSSLRSKTVPRRHGGDGRIVTLGDATLFRITSFYEIHKDPGGHYHHWSVACGTLIAGELSVGDRVLYTASCGTQLASVIIGFDGFRSPINSMTRLTADDVDGEFGVGLRSMAYRKDAVASSLLTVCDEQQYDDCIRGLMAAGWAFCPCYDCALAYRRLAEYHANWDDISWLDNPHGCRPRRPSGALP